jgi:predicted ester cyclase
VALVALPCVPSDSWAPPPRHSGSGSPPLLPRSRRTPPSPAPKPKPSPTVLPVRSRPIPTGSTSGLPRTSSVVGHIPLQPDGAEKGLDGLKHYASSIIDAISDAEITVEGLAIDGDKIVAHGELHGTHDGVLALLPATGKQVRVQYVIFTRIDQGKVVEYWYQLDILGALTQLGLFSIDDVTEDSEDEDY